MHMKLDYDPYNPLPLEVDQDHLGKYLEVEALSMVGDKANAKLVSVWRQRAVIVIFKYSKCEDFDPVTPYLAMNYFDRYISRVDSIPTVMSCRQHDLELLALCCLTLAWKIRNRNFIVTKFLVERPELCVITKEQMRNMELHILRGLDWHMRPVTALCFVPYFEPKFHLTYGFRRRCIHQIIIQSQCDISVAQFRPSVIAVSALLAASSFLYTPQFPEFLDKISSEIIFKEGHIEICLAHMIHLCKEFKLMIESSIPEDEYLPTKRVQAGTSSQLAIEIPPKDADDKLKQVAAEPSEQALIERSKQEAAEKSGQDVAESSTTQEASLNTEQVAESSNVGTSSRRPGKEKVEEVEMMEIPKMSEDSNDMQFDFRLRWLTAETIDNDFVIFSDLFLLEPNQAVQVPAAANPPQEPDIQPYCNFCCCSCNLF